MGSEINIGVSFGDEFQGVLTSASNSTIHIGMDKIRPYDMMLGALVSCYHHTFLEIVGKKRQKVANVEYRVFGKKRDSVPAMLEYVRMDVIVTNASDENQIGKSLELAKKYCSVFQTISHVAQIEVNVAYQQQT